MKSHAVSQSARPSEPTARPTAWSAAAGVARIGIDAHALSELRTGITTYVANLIAAMGRVASDEVISLYLHSQPSEPLPFPTVRVSRSPMWTSLRLAAHFAAHPAPRVMLYPAHTLPVHSPAKNVVTIHDLAFELFPEHFPASSRLRWQALTRFSARRADHLIADSHSTRVDLIRVLRVPEDRISVVHLGYDETHFRPVPAASVADVRQRYRLDRPYLVAVGTLQSRKNHAALVRALRIVRERGLDLDLVVCGAKGWLYDEIFATVSDLGLAEHVHFLGYVPYADLPALYKGAAAGALVSLYEGFGLPVLEALGCGTPMLVSDVSSLPEVGGDAVLLVDPRDIEAMAHQVERLVCDSALRAALAERTPAHLARFSWERTAHATLSILNQFS